MSKALLGVLGGGGVPLPNPLTLPNSSATPVLWLDAADSSKLTFDGAGNISKVLDKSGVFNDMIHPGGMTSAISGRATTMQGLGALRFNQWNLNTVNSLNTQLDRDSYFMVVQLNQINGYSFFFINNYDGQRQCGVNTTTFPASFFSSPSISSTIQIAQSVPVLLEVVRTAGTTTLYINGVACGSAGLNTPGFGSQLFIGSANADSNYIQDYVLGEMMVYSGFLTPTDRQYIENYFKLKWAL